MISLMGLSETVAMTLLHFLWQGAALGIGAGLFVLLLRNARPQARYAGLLALLGVMALCPFATMAYLEWPRPAAPAEVAVFGTAPAAVSPDAQATPTPSRPATAMNDPSVSAEPAPALFQPEPATTPPASPDANEFALTWPDIYPYATALYTASVLLMFIRLVLATFGGQRLRRCSTPVNDDAILQALAAQAAKLGLAMAPAVGYCARVTAPTVVGLVRPAILLPMSFASGLSPQQIEMILAHELAHIRRHDHWVNLAQRIVEALLFFHPAVWWVSRRIRFERELCCDDIVVAAGGEPLAYADTLLHFAETQRGIVPVGISARGDKPSDLRRRILRLIEGRDPMRVRLGRGALVATLALVLITGGVIFAQGQGGEEPDTNPEASTEDESFTEWDGSPFIFDFEVEEEIPLDRKFKVGSTKGLLELASISKNKDGLVVRLNINPLVPIPISMQPDITSARFRVALLDDSGNVLHESERPSNTLKSTSMSRDETVHEIALGYQFPEVDATRCRVTLLDSQATSRTVAEQDKTNKEATESAPESADTDKPRLQFRWVLPEDSDAPHDVLPLGDEELRVAREVVVDGDDIVSAVFRPSDDPARTDVFLIEFTEEAAARLADETGEHIGQRLAVVLKGEVITAPTVQSQIGASMQITPPPSKLQQLAQALGVEQESATHESTEAEDSVTLDDLELIDGDVRRWDGSPIALNLEPNAVIAENLFIEKGSLSFYIESISTYQTTDGLDVVIDMIEVQNSPRSLVFTVDLIATDGETLDSDRRPSVRNEVGQLTDEVESLLDSENLGVTRSLSYSFAKTEAARCRISVVGVTEPLVDRRSRLWPEYPNAEAAADSMTTQERSKSPTEQREEDEATSGEREITISAKYDADDPEGPAIIYVDDQRVPFEDLPEHLSNLIEEGKQPFIMVRPDRRIPTKTTVAIFDVLKNVGIINYGIAAALPADEDQGQGAGIPEERRHIEVPVALDGPQHPQQPLIIDGKEYVVGRVLFTPGPHGLDAEVTTYKESEAGPFPKLKGSLIDKRGVTIVEPLKIVSSSKQRLTGHSRFKVKVLTTYRSGELPPDGTRLRLAVDSDIKGFPVVIELNEDGEFVYGNDAVTPEVLVTWIATVLQVSPGREVVLRAPSQEALADHHMLLQTLRTMPTSAGLVIELTATKPDGERVPWDGSPITGEIALDKPIILNRVYEQDGKDYLLRSVKFGFNDHRTWLFFQVEWYLPSTHEYPGLQLQLVENDRSWARAQFDDRVLTKTNAIPGYAYRMEITGGRSAQDWTQYRLTVDDTVGKLSSAALALAENRPNFPITAPDPATDPATDPDPFARATEIAFDNGVAAGEVAGPGHRYEVSFRLLHYVPSKELKEEDLKFMGLRVFARRYGNEPENKAVIVILRDDDGDAYQESFPYSRFPTKPGWVTLLFNKLDADEFYTGDTEVELDPGSTEENGIAIAYSENAEVMHSFVSDGPRAAYDPAPGELMIRTYIGDMTPWDYQLRQVLGGKWPDTERLYVAPNEVPMPETEWPSPYLRTDDEATDTYRQLMENYPTTRAGAVAAFALVAALYDHARYEEALDVLRGPVTRLTQDSPNAEPHIMLWMGLIEEKRGNLQNAVERYEAAVQLARGTDPFEPLPEIETHKINEHIDNLREQAREQRIRELMGTAKAESPVTRAQTQEQAREQYEELMATLEEEDDIFRAFNAYNRYIASVPVSEGRDRITYEPFFDRFMEVTGVAIREDGQLVRGADHEQATTYNYKEFVGAMSRWNTDLGSGLPPNEVPWRLEHLVALINIERSAAYGEARKYLAEAIDHYVHHDYTDPKTQSYYQDLLALRFQLQAEESFEDAELQLLETFLEDPNFEYMPLEKIRQPYEQANALDRFERLVRAVIELNQEKIDKRPNRADLYREYEKEYASFLSEELPAANADEDVISRITEFHDELQAYRSNHPIESFLERCREQVIPLAIEGELARMRILEIASEKGESYIEENLQRHPAENARRIDATIQEWFSDIATKTIELLQSNSLELTEQQHVALENLRVKLKPLNESVDTTNPYPEGSLAHLNYLNDLKTAATSVAGLLSELLSTLPPELDAERRHLQEIREQLADANKEVPPVDPFQASLQEEWEKVTAAKSSSERFAGRSMEIVHRELVSWVPKRDAAKPLRKFMVKQSYANTFMGDTLCHAVLAIEADVLQEILKAQKEQHDTFKEGDNFSWVGHAFGEESSSTFDDDEPITLDWWNPDDHPAEQYVSWFHHQPRETPKTWVYVQISEGRSPGEKLVFLRVESG